MSQKNNSTTPSHAPENYVCPICLAIQGVESADTMIRQADIVYTDDIVMAVINSKFVKGNAGHVIIVPMKHYENLYELPDDISAEIMKVSKKIALALKAVRNCDGLTILQNNEPASEQHAFHYHMHVFPRFEHDHFHQNLLNAQISEPSERNQFAEELRKYLQDH